MKRKTSLISTVSIIMMSFLLLTGSSNGNRVLLIPREGSIDLEMALTRESGLMIRMLTDAGYDVVIATVSGEPLVGTTVTLNPDLKLSEVRVSDYIGVIMPCMNAGSPPAPAEAIRIVKEAASMGLPLAAQRGSVLILNSAGLRDPFDEPPGSSTDSEWFYGGTGVFQDGMIITSGVCPYYAMESGKPDGTAELTSRFIGLLDSKHKQANLY